MADTNLARPLLILDLDEMMVHGKDLEADEDNQPIPGLKIDFQVGTVIGYIRPHLREFLLRAWQRYDVAVWSAGGTEWVPGAVAVIMEGLPKPLFVWCSNRCTYKTIWEPGYARIKVKNLQKLFKRFDKKRMLIVDDTPEKCILNYGNAIYMTEWKGDQSDTELLDLAAYLESLADQPDFRKIEKRGWRKRYLETGSFKLGRDSQDK